MGQTMRNRAKNLKALGFASYDVYLRSPLWSKVKAATLFARPTCEMCGKAAQTAHHIKYSLEALLGTDPRCLASLCHECHRQIELDDDGGKLVTSDANTRLIVRLTQNGNTARAEEVAKVFGRRYRPEWYSGGYRVAKSGIRGRTERNRDRWRTS